MRLVKLQKLISKRLDSIEDNTNRSQEGFGNESSSCIQLF